MNLFSRNVVIHSFHGQMVYTFYIFFLRSCLHVCLSNIRYKMDIHSSIQSLYGRHKRSNKCEKRTKNAIHVQFFYSITFILWLLSVLLSQGLEKRNERYITNMSDIWIIFLLKSSNFLSSSDVIITNDRRSFFYIILTGFYCHLISSYSMSSYLHVYLEKVNKILFYCSLMMI